MRVYSYEGRTVYPLRFSKQRNAVNLLLINEEEKNHYGLIKDFSRLVSMQVSKYKVKMFFCGNCMQHFNKEVAFKKHEEYCWKNTPENIIMPEVKTVEGKEIIPEIKFEHHNRREKVPFVIYAYFEALNESIHSCEQDPEMSFTNQYQKHKPCGFCYLIKCFDETVYQSKTVENEDEDIPQVFVDMLEKEIVQLHEEFDFYKPMLYNDIDKADFEKETTCWICGLPFEEQKKVRDHCQSRSSSQPL